MTQEQLKFNPNPLVSFLEKPMAERSTPIIPLLREEALPVFRQWTLKADKTEY